MDRLLEALKRLTDEPAPAAVEPITERELREAERLAPFVPRVLVGAAISSSVAKVADFDEMAEDSPFYAPEEVLFEAGLREVNFAEAACDPWTELEGVLDSEPSETRESAAPDLDDSDLVDSSSLLNVLDTSDSSILKELAAHIESIEESLAEGSPILIEPEDSSEADVSPVLSEPQEIHPAVNSDIETEVLEESASEEQGSSQVDPPAWEWADEPYRELLTRITENQSQGISHAVAITSVDDSPDREMAVAGLAKAYALTSGERVLVVSARRHSSRIVEQLGVEPPRITKSDAVSSSKEFSKIMPTRYGRADFLCLDDLFPSDPSQEGGVVDPMLVTKWRGQYSLILLDTGSWGGSFIFPLARQCDATYVFLGLGVTLRETALDVITRMKRGGIRVAGCVLTGSRSGESL